jgi:hypothetical protein
MTTIEPYSFVDNLPYSGLNNTSDSVFFGDVYNSTPHPRRVGRPPSSSLRRCSSQMRQMSLPIPHVPTRILRLAKDLRHRHQEHQHKPMHKRSQSASWCGLKCGNKQYGFVTVCALVCVGALGDDVASLLQAEVSGLAHVELANSSDAFAKNIAEENSKEVYQPDEGGGYCCRHRRRRRCLTCY